MEGLDRKTWKRRTALVALVAVIGATVYGDSRDLSGNGLAAPVAGAIRAGETVGRWARTVENFASIGLLYATVLSGLDPAARRSILAAIDGAREVCTGRGPAAPVTQCAAAKKTGPRKAVRCARA
ncbi:MAG TPA: hypothetical protein VFL12_09160 [Thermoanaerobaculia bacterium]|nr:hypothetical protein [Thermoanaerobaculia bacterium]